MARFSRPAGALRARFIVESPVETRDGAGGVSRSFAETARCWGEIRPVSGEDERRAGSLGQAISHRVALRWRADLDTSKRLRRAGRVFAIRAVWDPDERRRSLVCLCEELKP